MAGGIAGSGPRWDPASGGVPGPHRAVPHRVAPGREDTPGQAPRHREPGGVGPPLTAEVTVVARTATVVLRGELDPATMPLLARQLARVLADRPRRLVLDMAGVTFIDCASARLIAGAGRHLPGGARPVIRSPSLVARRILELTGLTDCLDTGDPGPGLPAARSGLRARVTRCPISGWARAAPAGRGTRAAR